MVNFERTRPFDEQRVLFKLFAQLLREIRKLPLPEHTAQRVCLMEMEIEDFLAKMSQERGQEFNMERFRAVADPRNREEVA